METQKTKSQVAAIKRWFKITKEQRSAHARKMVKARFSKMTKEQLSEHARKLAQIRWKKKLST